MRKAILNPDAKIHWKDLPRFTRSAPYEIDVSWWSIEDTMASWGRDQLVNTHPHYQRAHVWTPDKQVAYVEYCMKGGHAAKDIRWNCSTWGRGWNTPVELVDGKQRLEAVRKFMRDELKAFGYLASEFDVLDMFSCRMRWYVNDLKTRAEVLQWYLDLNEGGVVHTQDELQRVRDMLLEETKFK